MPAIRQVTLEGLGVYTGGAFVIEFDFSDTYPYKCPKFKFLTKIYHPGVCRETGKICLDLEKSWIPSNT